MITREEVTRVLGVNLTGSMDYDQKRIYRYHSNFREEFAWPEHPNGRWTRLTNGDGARESHEFPIAPPEFFVLVAGDSHTDGLCDNVESYSNRLELELAQRHDGHSIEVYNTGVSGYSFYNYLGVLEDFLARKPDVFVSVFFGGNDFFEVLKVQHLYAGTVPPPRSRGYWTQLSSAKALPEATLAQGLNQLLYLRENPDQMDLSLKAALFATSEIQRLCAENGVEWIAVYLPSAFDLPSPKLAELRARAKANLSLSDADFELSNRMADQLLTTLRERGVETLDLRPAFRAQDQELYWSDLHINLRGQQVVAYELLPRVERMFTDRSTRRARATTQSARDK